MVVLVKCVRLALSEQSERKYASRVSVSERMQIGFLSYEVAKNARQQVCTDLYTSEASLIERSEINEKKKKFGAKKNENPFFIFFKFFFLSF